MRGKVFKPDEEQLIDIHEIKVSAIHVINTPLLKTKDLCYRRRTVIFYL